jgi:DNA-binding CsgD family transcriptional regulator
MKVTERMVRVIIGPGTVGGYVANLLGKPGVEPRTAAVASLIRQGVV